MTRRAVAFWYGLIAVILACLSASATLTLCVRYVHNWFIFSGLILAECAMLLLAYFITDHFYKRIAGER